MDTISNMASAATKAVWGDQQNPDARDNETAGNEPLSGQQGKGTANEPYDQGNAKEPTDAKSTSFTANPTSTLEPSSTTDSSLPKADSANSSTPMNPNNAASGGEPTPLQDTEGTGVTSKQGDPTKGSDVIPSNASSNPGAAPESGSAPGAPPAQGGAAPKAAPSGEESGAVKESKDTAEDVMKNRDPNDHSGEPLKVHDGSEVPATQEERRVSKAGMPGGIPHEGEPKGTGEQHVKTTGLAKDGGDFDATKPGAGREAERLMEEKGIRKEDSHTSDAQQSQTSADGGNGDKDKESKMDKLKTKLHIGHKDK